YGDSGNEIVSNSYGFRLRHAYGSMNGFLMGQTWTTFMDLASVSELLDFSHHSSVIFARQAQLRYTKPLENGKLMFAIENPHTLVNDNNELPDLVARYDYNSSDKRTHASAALLLRQLKNADGDEETGAAINLTGKFKIGSSGDSLALQVSHGALGRYMGLLAHSATQGSGDTFDTLDSTGVSIGYQHFWNKAVRSTLKFAATDADEGTTLKGVQSVHANLLWNLSRELRLGVELQRKTYDFHAEDRPDVDLDRIQFSARYMF
ncbi:MAG: DcaP family trimeric outer membrane transporter, partial [Candidatus Thiodiazotropha sp.]